MKDAVPASGADPLPEEGKPPVEVPPPERRRVPDRRQRQLPVTYERRSGGDRRTGEDLRALPTPSEAADEDLLEFMRAIQAFKERSGKTFPAWSDVLRILRELGYEKRE